MYYTIKEVAGTKKHIEPINQGDVYENYNSKKWNRIKGSKSMQTS